MSGCKEEKQYGLIIPKKQQPVPPKAKNIFADDDGSDEEDGTDWVKKALKAEGEKNKIKKQTKLTMQKALKEDPTIYQYDEVYDDMERTKTQAKVTSEEKKKPKYILNLLKAAERRKKEQEYRIERMVQKEREAEGEMFADKESFVTSAYRAKLEEFRQMEEEESRMDRLEAIGDVTKQQDMSGFYRHLYEQTVEMPKETEDADGEKTNNVDKDESTSTASNDMDNSSKKVEEETASKEQATSIKAKKSRQYRQRVIEEEESDVEPEIKQEVEDTSETPLTTKNKDDNEDSKDESPRKKQKQQLENSESDKELSKVPAEVSKDPESAPESSEKSPEENKPDTTAIMKIAAEKKEKSKIWEKRTIGPVFDAALQRYFERKAIRLSGA